MAIEDTVRKRVIRAVKGYYTNVSDTDPNPGDPADLRVNYGMVFSSVKIGPLTDQDARKRVSLGIVAGSERKSDLYPYKTAMFELHIEWRVTVNKDDAEPGLLAEDVLGVVQQVLYDNPTISGLAVKADETGSEVNLLSYSDKAIDGVVTFTVHYRHNAQTVYSEHPSV